MRVRRLLPTLAFLFTLSFAPAALAQDAGAPVDAAAIPPPPADTPPADAASSPDPATATPPSSSSGSASKVDPQDPESLAKATYRAITTRNWFLLAGAILAMVALVANYLLKKKWRMFEKDRVRWVTTGVLAGMGALAHAWLADVPVASSTTFFGAVKVFAAAVFAYVSTKKLLATAETAGDSSTAA